MDRSKNSRGFSLIELLLAVSIMTVMTAMLYTIFQTTTSVWKTGDARVEMFQNARSLLDRLGSDLESATVQAENNMNCFVIAQAIYFVNKGVYQNGSTDVTGFQEIGYVFQHGDGNDIDFTDDTVDVLVRHSQSSPTFQFESDFSKLQDKDPDTVASLVVDFQLDCWDDLAGEWIEWSAWPGSPAIPYWNVINPVSSNDPDEANYEPSDPSNKGKMPLKIRITMKMIPPDKAEWINQLSSTSFNSYTQGQSGSKREKIIAKLENEGVIEEYSLVVVLAQTH